MDALLSLPIVSYLFSSSLTSWSTSLNLLFFYMTWSTLVLSHSPLRIELIGTTAIRLVLWLIPSLLFLLFDTLVPSLSETIKRRGANALPPRDLSALSRTLGLALFNTALSTVLEASISQLLSLGLHTSVFPTSATLPLPWQAIRQLLLLFTAREVLTYYIHRHLLHKSTTLPSRLHMSYAHSHRAPPYSLLLAADHPLPYILHRFVPLYLPAAALRPHLLVYLLFAAMSTLEETLAMSGYTVVPGIMMGGVARRCSTHYSSGGKGNYGAWGLLDWIHGTTGGRGDVVDDIRREGKKHGIKENGESGVLSSGIEGLRRSARKGRGKRA
jgi:hypothetical protein